MNDTIVVEQEIFNFNKRCAEFLGYQILFKKYQRQNFNSSDESYFEWGEGNIVCDAYGEEVSLFPDSDPLFNLSDLPFASDWNLLMEVVDNIQIKHKVFVDIMGYDACKIYCAYPKHYLNHRPWLDICHFSDSRKEALISAINEFFNIFKEDDKL